MMTMKHFESHLKTCDYYREMGDTFNKYYPIENQPYFDTIIRAGFMNSYSYYSVVHHEKYALADGEKRLFMWRNGNLDNYHVEFNDETLVDRIASIPDFPVQQHNNVFTFLFFSERILNQFVGEFRK